MNDRKSQVIAVLLVILPAGLIMLAPFVWRALKTRDVSDLRTAVLMCLPQAVLYTVWALDPGQGDQLSAFGGALIWAMILLTAFVAAWTFRPLNKVEQMDQVQQQRSGSSFL